jgi:hypothetical protein
MYGTLLTDKTGKISSKKSDYQPTPEIRDLTIVVKDAYEDGEAVLAAPMQEYNGLSITQRANESQKTWLAHADAPYEGDDEWRWNGVRPITRNRVIATAARLTSQMLYPKHFAQNEDQEEDKNASYAMDALVEYNIRHSNYDTAFLFGVIGGLVNPISYFSVEYCEAWQWSWVRGEQQRIIDDIYSGFQHSLIPIDEMLFGNPYQFEWQKQDWIIRKRRVAYEEMEAKHGLHENWGSVKKGVITMVAADGFFYDVDDINDDMVGSVTYKHRRSDCEIDFVNGIYLSNPNTAYNPFYHRKIKTVKGAVVEVPLYDTVKYGFEPIDAMRFVGYKSLVDKMQNDQEATDREWQDYFDASRLATFMPLVTMGAGKIDKTVISPAGVTELGKDAKAVPLSVSNPSAALSALREAERSASEDSLDPQAFGMQNGPKKTQVEAQILEQNTQTNLTLTAKMIAKMVQQVGGLLDDDIIRHQTIGEAGDIAGTMFYKTFVVGGRVKEGRSVSTYIRFTDRFAGAPMTEQEREMEEYDLMSKSGEDKDILEINPGVFARLDFLTTIDSDALLRRNDAFERAFKVSIYEKAIANPLILQDADAMNKITRDFLLEPAVRGDASKYLPNIKAIAAQVTPGTLQTPPTPAPGLPQRVVNQGASAGMLS